MISASSDRKECSMNFANDVESLLEQLGPRPTGNMPVFSPIDGSQIGSVQEADATEIEEALERSRSAFLVWRNVPAPRRGELVRLSIRNIEDKRARERAKAATKAEASLHGKLIEGTTTQGWNEALGALVIAFPERFAGQLN